jgi:hypothetical protein
VLVLLVLLTHTLTPLTLQILRLLSLLVRSMIFIVHQDLGDVELGNRSHASGPLDIHVPLELARIVKHVEEA